MLNDHKKDMLFHKVAILVALVLVSYLSAVPVLLHNQGKYTKKRNKLTLSHTVLSPLPQPNSTNSTNEGVIGEETNLKEPWEVNQGLRFYDGIPFFQGDIVLDPNARAYMQGGGERGRVRRRRAVKKLKEARWPNGVIPYVISKNLDHKTRKEIRKAIRHWRRRTCLHFRHKKATDKDYIIFVYEAGCWSYVGKSGGQQKISVGPGCEFMGTIIHEIGHAVGFWHEQSRRDRDEYIRIMRENIQENARDQFDKMPKRVLDSKGYAYDYGSIMHYGNKFFSKNGRPTIKIRKIGRKAHVRIGQRRGLSFLDIAQVMAMYNCHKKKLNASALCIKKPDGYRGNINYTEKGVLCQPWNEKWPHNVKEWSHNPLRNSLNGLGRHNKCRNPHGRRDRPWCYTTLKKPVWQYCHIKVCTT